MFAKIQKVWKTQAFHLFEMKIQNSLEKRNELFLLGGVRKVGHELAKQRNTSLCASRGFIYFADK